MFGEVVDGKSIVRKIENLKTQSDKPLQAATITGKEQGYSFVSTYHRAHCGIDCGDMDDTSAAKITKTVDNTGDAYEDYPEDHADAKELETNGPKMFQLVMEIKEYGNKAFKGGDVQLGLDKYLKGLRYLRTFTGEADQNPVDEINAVRFTLLSNAALLENKLRRYADAKKSAGEALALSGTKPSEQAKAYFRRAQAEVGLKDDEAAIKDLGEASKLAPGDPAISKELAAVKKRAAESAAKEKAAFKKFFD